MDAVQASVLDALAASQGRSVAGQMKWLLHLGLSAVHLIPGDVPVMDVAGERRYFYPHNSGALDQLVDEFNAKRTPDSREWSFSSLVRCLIDQGMSIDRQMAQYTALALARLEVGRDSAGSPRDLALHLTLHHSTEELLDMLGEGPTAGQIATWGTACDDFERAVTVALEIHSTLASIDPPLGEINTIKD